MNPFELPKSEKSKRFLALPVEVQVEVLRNEMADLAQFGGLPYHESDEAMGMIMRAWKNQLIRAGTKTEADFAGFDIFKTFAAKKPKEGKPKTAREKAILESLKRSIAEEERKLDVKLAAVAKMAEDDKVAEAEKEAERKRKRTEKRKAEKLRAKERKEAEKVEKEEKGSEAMDADEP